jgi:hypothetical protein
MYDTDREAFGYVHGPPTKSFGLADLLALTAATVVNCSIILGNYPNVDVRGSSWTLFPFRKF